MAVSFSRAALLEAGVPEEAITAVLSLRSRSLADWTPNDEVESRLKEVTHRAEVAEEALKQVQKDLETLRASAPNAAKIQSDFDEYKKGVEQKELNSNKLKALLTALKAAGANALVVDLLAQSVPLDDVVLNEKGEMASTQIVETLKQQRPQLFGQEQTMGVPPMVPPTGMPMGTLSREAYNKLSLADQFKYIQDHPAEAATLLKP